METLKTFLQIENFNGLPLTNSGNQCYAISSLNLLLSSGILSEAIEQKESNQIVGSYG